MDIHGILVVYKPRGVTSHDVVARVRRLLKTRKVGHAGTLDPAAEGVLVLAVGRATKLLAEMSGHSKRYAAHIVLGVGSESGDIEGPAIVPFERITAPDVEGVSASIARFIGEIEQVPPAYSAIKVEGQPLYRKARRGEAIDVPRRMIRISHINLLEYRYPNLYLDIECSAGTYVRSLARDIGDALGTGGYLHFLLRTQVGQFSLDDAWSLDELDAGLAPVTFSHFALHPAISRHRQHALLLSPDASNAWYDGRPIPGSGSSEVDRADAFDIDGSWLGIGVHEGARDPWQPKMVVHA